MKFMILFALVAAAFADELAEVLRDDREGPLGAVYNFIVETSNGIQMQETGSEGSAGQAVASGSYSYTNDNGEVVAVSYNADEGGFQAQSDWLPVGPEMPPHALEQIQIAADQRASGVDWDQQGFVI